MTQYEPVIGLEMHAELMTESKMFSKAKVVDSVEAAPNTAVSPLCLGMPGTLPVINEKAVEYATRVALARLADQPAGLLRPALSRIQSQSGRLRPAAVHRQLAGLAAPALAAVARCAGH